MDSAGLSSFTDKLGASDDVTIEADVKDFEVPQMYFGATNEIQLSELSDMDDLSELTSKLQPLFDGAEPACGRRSQTERRCRSAAGRNNTPSPTAWAL